MAQSQGGKAVSESNFAFVYVHAWNGSIRVETLGTAKSLNDRPEWKHVSTINPYAWLEMILRASIKDRNLLIKHLLK
jgi:hypothetical protein